MVCNYSFSLSRIPVTRDLLSFPTRRSSDLARFSSAPVPRRPTHDGTALRRCSRGLGGGEDRKSTRLNSSHVKISYAVFCLKKKSQQLLRNQSRLVKVGLPIAMR